VSERGSDEQKENDCDGKQFFHSCPSKDDLLVFAQTAEQANYSGRVADE
jgi:hypothetical protein